MREQPALDAELEAVGARAHEAADPSARSDDAMARDDERDGIGAARAAHRAGRRAQHRRDLAVAARLAGGNALHRLPHFHAMARAREAQRQVELEAAVL